MGLVKQTTLGDRIVVDGIGVHSGRPARVILHPADANSGYVFLRTGLAGGRERLIEARFGAVRQTELCTVIGSDCGATVSTVEHCLAALAGLGVDNALIEIDGPELPILDGSSRVFVEAIDQVGVVPLSANRKVLKVLKPVRVENGRSYAELVPGGNTLSLDVEIAFDTPVIGRQARSFDLTPGRFRSEISAARTFGFMKDVEMLWKAGFALGASLENTVAVGDDRVINPEGLRFADEFVRHKILDAVGDLALAGYMLRGTYRAFCPGHKLNVMMLQKLFDDRSAYAIVDATTARRDISRETGHGELVAPAPAFGPHTR
ncbi:MAG: UDP-3-O-acyl-N-acetylglucosamine deacetylase [Proteobacteria bacterium]|nr:UDP-3-O-acyl-N-acetylglucosamine deacetylase [Pseudomonadota bacterium]